MDDEVRSCNVGKPYKTRLVLTTTFFFFASSTLYPRFFFPNCAFVIRACTSCRICGLTFLSFRQSARLDLDSYEAIFSPPFKLPWYPCSGPKKKRSITLKVISSPSFRPFYALCLKILTTTSFLSRCGGHPSLPSSSPRLLLSPPSPVLL